jgi:hypothetical protein
MNSKPKLGAKWRQIIGEASGVVARMLLLAQNDVRERRIYVREPRRAEIEHWLRTRK